MKRYQKFIVFWLINAALLYLVAMFMPANFKLGNNIFTAIQAALFTGFVWNWVLWNSESTFKDLEIDVRSPMAMMIAYLGVNFVTIWLLARFAFMSGFGVSSYIYVFMLALVGNLLQYMAWRVMDKKK